MALRIPARVRKHIVNEDQITTRKIWDCYIYGLLEPDQSALRYVGRTKDPVARFAAHIHPNRRQQPRVKEWIRSILAHGKHPKMLIFCHLSIGQYRFPGCLVLERNLEAMVIQEAITNPSSCFYGMKVDLLNHVLPTVSRPHKSKHAAAGSSASRGPKGSEGNDWITIASRLGVS